MSENACQKCPTGAKSTNLCCCFVATLEHCVLTIGPQPLWPLQFVIFQTPIQSDGERHLEPASAACLKMMTSKNFSQNQSPAKRMQETSQPHVSNDTCAGTISTVAQMARNVTRAKASHERAVKPAAHHLAISTAKQITLELDGASNLRH